MHLLDGDDPAVTVNSLVCFRPISIILLKVLEFLGAASDNMLA